MKKWDTNKFRVTFDRSDPDPGLKIGSASSFSPRVVSGFRQSWLRSATLNFCRTVRHEWDLNIFPDLYKIYVKAVCVSGWVADPDWVKPDPVPTSEEKPDPDPDLTLEKQPGSRSGSDPREKKPGSGSDRQEKPDPDLTLAKQSG